MEIGIVLLAFVATIGLFHITHRITTRIRKRLHANEQVHSKKAKARSDWFCFFSSSSLYGAKPTRKDVKTDKVSDSDKIKRRRRAQANRPRIHV